MANDVSRVKGGVRPRAVSPPERWIRSSGGWAAPGLVRAGGARAAVARDAGSVRDPRQRGDGAADAGRPRRPALARLARALADRRSARRRLARRRDPRMAGARL